MITVKRNRDGSWSASSKLDGRPFVAEGKTLGTAMVACLTLMIDDQEKKTRVIH